MRLSLAHLTVLDATPLELIDAAAAGGFDAAGLRIIPPMPTDKIVDVIGNESLTKELKRQMGATGISIWDIEAVWLTPETNVATLVPALELGERLGAKHLLVVGHDPDFSRLVDNFAALCDQCARFKLEAALEMMSYVELRTLQQANRLLEAAGRDNAHMLIDALHFFRSGAQPSDLSAVNPSVLKYIHLCDAPLAAPPADALRAEGRGGRSYPGQGEFPLIELLDALPRDIPIAIEAPNQKLAHLPVVERAKLAGEATRQLIQDARAARDL
jgi:sugar phosphate isomerase/epimerase